MKWVRDRSGRFEQRPFYSQDETGFAVPEISPRVF